MKNYIPSKKIINELNKIAIQYHTKINFVKTYRKNTCAWYNQLNKQIYIRINHNYSKSDLINSFFHELGHHYCVMNGLWESYHFFKGNAKYTWLKAERWVDKWASERINEIYPKIKYDFPYSDKEIIKYSRIKLKKLKYPYNIF